MINGSKWIKEKILERKGQIRCGQVVNWIRLEIFGGEFYRTSGSRVADTG